MTTLRDLEAVAYQLSSRRIDDLDACGNGSPSSSYPVRLSAALDRKLTSREADESLWIAKFPARDDDRDVAAWEYVAHQLAKKAGIDVPRAKLIRLNNDFHTFCVQEGSTVEMALGGSMPLR